MHEVFQGMVVNFAEKKEVVDRWVNEARFVRDASESFESDRVMGTQPSYLSEFGELFREEITQFCKGIQSNLNLCDAWLVRYNKGDWHIPHAHGHLGYSGIILIDYDTNEHSGPWFIKDSVDPITGSTTFIGGHQYQPGTIFITRSDRIHFTFPNPVDKPKVTLAFDLKPE